MIKVLVIDNKELPYKIVVKNNKNTYIRFKDDHIEVSKSKHVSTKDVIKLMETNFDKYYNKFMTLQKSVPLENEIILEGKTYEIDLFKASKFSYVIHGDTVKIGTNKTDLEVIKKMVYKDYLSKMIELIKPKYETVLKEFKIAPREIKLGYFKTKFGSYHRLSDIIKLNIVLAKVDINYLYYVIMHEYAHTKVFNHSKDFYNLLEQLMPNYRYYDKNLKKISIWI